MILINDDESERERSERERSERERMPIAPESKDTSMKILFLCFHNSARSQMAEGLLRAMYVDKYEVYSAGIKATEVDPRAVKVMSEIGIDISGQRSKSMDEFKGVLFDLAITVCDKAKEACPLCGVGLKASARVPTAKEALHKTFKDPATAEGSEEEQLVAFRQVRDEIKEWIMQTFRDNSVLREIQN
jgi:arsenate reductase